MNRKLAVHKSSLPGELKLEEYERKHFFCTFDRIDLTMKFRGGKNNIGAILASWIDAIKYHDELVKIVEEKLYEVDQRKLSYKKNNRIYRNWSASWNFLNEHPEDYEEYLEILPRMIGFEERIKKITDPEAKARANVDLKRFKELEIVCSRIHSAQLSLKEAEKLRDQTRNELVLAENELNLLKEEEKKAAYKISDDHVIADEKKVFLSEIFPTIKEGYILATINDVEVENMPFQEISAILKSAGSPSTASFRRYDYRLDLMTGEWFSLQELREKSIYVDDPRIPRVEFVRRASEGNQEAIMDNLWRGEDINAVDHTGCSALHAAAANNFPELVLYLHKAGAVVDNRDKNMMTPLLSCARKGNLELVVLLVSLGANVLSTDRLLRNAIYYSVCSSNVELVKYILSKFKNKSKDKSKATGTNQIYNRNHRMEVQDTFKPQLEVDDFYERIRNFPDSANNVQEAIEEEAREVETEAEDDVRGLRSGTCNQPEAVWGWTSLHAAANRGDNNMIRALLRSSASIYCLSKSGKTPEEVARDAGHVDTFQLLRTVRFEAPAQLVLKLPNNGSCIWLGSQNAMTPKYIAEIGVTQILYCHHPTFPNPLHRKFRSVFPPLTDTQIMDDLISKEKQKFYESFGWLQEDDQVRHQFEYLGVNDGDESETSWLEFSKKINTFLNIISQYIDQDDGSPGNILICDTSGNSTAPAVLSCYLLLRKQLTVVEAVRMIREARPQISISLSLRRGLEQLQRMQEDKKLQRLRNRVRNSAALSCAF